MMRTELKKLCSFRVVWILLACLLGVNGYVLIVWIVSKCKSLVSAYCVNAVIFVLPVVLYLLGLNAFQWVGITPVLRGIF